MAKRLEDKVAIVTGAGSSGPGWGNGKATAVLFAREGARVLCLDINRDAVEETRSIIEQEGGDCRVRQCDVTCADQVQATVAQCLENYGRIDILHNNVGILELGGPVETSEESWDRVNSVNLKSMFLTCKYTLPHMEKQGAGAIVNLSSIGGLVGLATSVPYCASKGGVIQLTRALGVEWATEGVRVNALAPTAFDTPMLRDAMEADPRYRERVLERVPVGRIGELREIVGAALFLASDASTMVTGTVLPVDGGFTAQ